MHVPEWFTRNFPSTSLDGELWTGKEQFSELVSIVRRENANAGWEKVRYLIFDDPQIEVGFEKRLDFACRWFLELPNQFVEVLEQQICEGGEHLRRKLSEIESHGGEGLMLRGPDSPYTIGRSYNLLKVKTYEDAEATVIRHISGSGRNAGRLGSLLVELPNGIQFAIGTGFSDQERDNPPPVGSTITFKYYGFYKSGIPGSLPFIVSGKSFEEKDFMDLIYTAIDSSIVSYSTRGVTSLRPTFFRSKSIRLSDSNIVISTVMLLMSLLANLAMH